MNCPYSSFSDEDGNYAVPILDPSGDLLKICVGVIATTTDIFDPKDVLLLEADSSKDPESLLIALNMKQSSMKLQADKVLLGIIVSEILSQLGRHGNEVDSASIYKFGLDTIMGEKIESGRFMESRFHSPRRIRIGLAG